MKPLREWIENEINKVIESPLWDSDCAKERARMNGRTLGMKMVLDELKAREEAERERVNENVNALDSLAGETLIEKEGGAGCNPEL